MCECSSDTPRRLDTSEWLLIESVRENVDRFPPSFSVMDSLDLSPPASTATTTTRLPSGTGTVDFRREEQRNSRPLISLLNIPEQNDDTILSHLFEFIRLLRAKKGFLAFLLCWFLLWTYIVVWNYNLGLERKLHKTCLEDSSESRLGVVVTNNSYTAPGGSLLEVFYRLPNPKICSTSDYSRRIPVDLLSASPSNLLVFLCQKKENYDISSPYDFLIVKDVKFLNDTVLIWNANEANDLRLFYYYCVRGRQDCEKYSSVNDDKEYFPKSSDTDCVLGYSLHGLKLCFTVGNDRKLVYGYLYTIGLISTREILRLLSIVEYWF